MPRSGAHRPPLGPGVVQRVCDLYTAAGLSTRTIAAELGLSRRVVTDVLRSARVTIASRGTGRDRPQTRLPRPAGLRDQLVSLYVHQRLTRAQVAAALGVPEHRVATWLRECQIARRTRGRGTRQDRRRIDPETLQTLYVDTELPAAQVAHAVGASPGQVLASLHENALPVRVGGPLDPQRATAVLTALYTDPEILRILHTHHVRLVHRGGPAPDRFPTPVPLAPQLLHDLYQAAGLSAAQIELLTGQPAATVRRHLQDAGITLRAPGGLAPFTRRIRQTNLSRADRPGEG